MANNRGVVYAGPGRVEVQSIDFPKLALDSRKCEHGLILKLVAPTSAASDPSLWYEAAPRSYGYGPRSRVTGEIIEKGRDVDS